MAGIARPAAALALVGAALAAPATADRVKPLPLLHGSRLATPTHLRLVVANDPPVILDVDRGNVRAVTGIDVSGPPVLWVLPMPGGAFATVDRVCPGCSGQTEGYRIQSDGTAHRLASGSSLVPAWDTHRVWLLDRRGGRCTLRLVPGRRAPVRAPCGFLAESTPAGLVLLARKGAALIDPASGDVRASAPALEPISADTVLESRGYRDLALRDLSTGTRRPLRWPSTLDGLDEIRVRPGAGRVAVGFADPAHPGPEQAEDVWLLDPATGTFTHLPGFPAQIDLKFSSMTWSADGRLVLLAQGGGRTVVAVWRDGQPRLALRRVELPERDSGSDSFVALTR